MNSAASSLSLHNSAAREADQKPSPPFSIEFASEIEWTRSLFDIILWFIGMDSKRRKARANKAIKKEAILLGWKIFNEMMRNAKSSQRPNGRAAFHLIDAILVSSFGSPLAQKHSEYDAVNLCQALDAIYHARKGLESQLWRMPQASSGFEKGWSKNSSKPWRNGSSQASISISIMVPSTLFSSSCN